MHELSGAQVPGVSAIKSMWPAGALGNWFKKFTAEYCVDSLEAVNAVAKADRSAAVELVTGAVKRYTKKAADRGTQVHNMVEQIMVDKMAGRKSTFKVTAEDMQYLRNFAQFVSEFEVEPVMVETTVWSREHNYAGTFDLLCRLKGYEGLYIVDYKSGQSGVYPETGLQQIAYMNAGEYIDEDGNFQPLPEIAGAFGMWLRPDGWALYPLRTDDVVWQQFLKLREAYSFKQNIWDTIVHKPVNAKPLKKKWKGNK